MAQVCVSLLPERRPRLSFRILTSVWPSPSYCGHWGNEPGKRSLLSWLSAFQINKSLKETTFQLNSQKACEKLNSKLVFLVPKFLTSMHIFFIISIYMNCLETPCIWDCVCFNSSQCSSLQDRIHWNYAFQLFRMVQLQSKTSDKMPRVWHTQKQLSLVKGSHDTSLHSSYRIKCLLYAR